MGFGTGQMVFSPLRYFIPKHGRLSIVKVFAGITTCFQKNLEIVKVMLDNSYLFFQQEILKEIINGK